MTKGISSSNYSKPVYLLFSLFFAISFVQAQTTFTESASAYNLNIGGGKDGGHAWADYDADGDYDLVINTNGQGYLLRNDGGSFTDVTAALAPDFFNHTLERSALFTDFNNDGYPDVLRNDNARVKIYLQDPATNIFGDGVGGTTPNQIFTSANVTDGFNAEGAGALDFDGDGDLDIYIDNHNYGIDILLNDGTGNFTHATAKAASPNPPYNVGDPTTWPLGLVQDATDGDYGSATDFNNDGWVDIVVRKRNQVDLFTNVGGSFVNGVDIADANNGNKGSVAFYDFDNDGDFDLFWTENDGNQIHRNNGDGTWTALGAGTGIPLNFPGQIEGLACGDVDNDGDIDIFLANGNNNPSYLYLNQINNGGGAMNFVNSGLTFDTRGEGCSFIDIDEDGDLDLYMNRNGTNRLFINNLGATARGNHLYVKIIEDRDAFGLINTEERFGVGATAKILDCTGNVISGIREVNGGYGHGTQENGVMHFGLPSGPSTAIVVEVAYPRTVSGRVVVRQQLTPSDYFNGSINILDVITDQANLPPTAEDDNVVTGLNTSIIIDPLLDNGNGVDADPESQPLVVISITQSANGSAVLNGDGTVTYTPTLGFSGTDTFTYTIEDNAICSFTAEQDSATITILVMQDTDGDGISDNIDLDDDNDGILDLVENSKSVLWVTNGTPGTEEQNVIDKLTALGYTVTAIDDNAGGYDADDYAVTFIYEDSNSGAAFGTVANLATSQQGVITSETYLHDDILGASQGATTNANVLNIINNTHPITLGLALGNLDIGNASYRANGITSGTILGRHPNGEASLVAWEVGDAFPLGTAPGRRAIVPHNNDGAFGAYNTTGEDLLVQSIIWTAATDTDQDGVYDDLDLDSDNDGIYDVVEGGALSVSGVNDADDDGIIDGLSADFGANGLHTNIENNDTSSAAITYTITDTDGDLIYDPYELDADNDGCNDVLEAGYTESGPVTGELQGTGYNATTGLVTGNADGYTTPADGDTNTVFDFQEAGVAPAISIQPIDVTVSLGGNTSFTITATNADVYQWQIFNGVSWVDITDTGIHSGATTSTLLINNPANSDDGNQYRVLVSSAVFVCQNELSNTVILTVNVGSVITNRRVTYRVNKN